MKIPEMAVVHIIINLLRYFFFTSLAYLIFYIIYKKMG